MLIFGHAGITLGAAALLNGALSKSCLPTAQGCTSGSKASWLTSLGNHIDIRLLLIGSILPDIVDKPIGLYLFRDSFSTGRIFCHTLLFLSIITVAGLYLFKSRGKVRLLILSFGTLAHLILDQMWLVPQALLWPLYGFTFPPTDLTDWTLDRFHALTHPGIYVPELIGAVILIWFILMLVRNRKVYAFVKKGKVL